MALCAMRWFMKQKPNYSKAEYLHLIDTCDDLDTIRLIKEQFVEDRHNNSIDVWDSLDIAASLSFKLIDLQIKFGLSGED